MTPKQMTELTNEIINCVTAYHERNHCEVTCSQDVSELAVVFFTSGVTALKAGGADFMVAMQLFLGVASEYYPDVKVGTVDVTGDAPKLSVYGSDHGSAKP